MQENPFTSIDYFIFQFWNCEVVKYRLFSSWTVISLFIFADTKCPLCPRLFGIPLNQLCSEEERVPKAVQELLLYLFRYGPNITGIFRKSANARIAKEVKLELDEG